jgi:hypothetical protein
MSSDLYIESEYDPSSSNTLEPWNKVQSSYAIKRKKMQQERMRQLKELEEQVTETANWNNQRRKEIVSSTNSTRYQRSKETTVEQQHQLTPSSSTSTTSSAASVNRRSRENSAKIDLGDATLEDLEGLIAASAKRLASYRLRNQKPAAVEESTTKKSEEMSRWKELLDNNNASESSSLSRLSIQKHYNADPITDNNSASSPRDSTGEKSPSASYLRLRNMFEKDPSSPSTKINTLADLANSSSTSLSTSKKNHSKTNSDLLLPSNNMMTTTRSTLSNATPKLSLVDSPRISSSSTHQPRVSNSSHLRKATRSYSYQNIMQPIESSSSSSVSVDKINSTATTETTTRSRKLSTLASLQQRQRQNHHLINSTKEEQVVEEQEEEEEREIKTVDDYINIIKKPSSSSNYQRIRADSHAVVSEASSRKVKTSIISINGTTPSNSTSGRKIVAVTPKENILKPGITTLSNGKTVVQRRKRGKVRCFFFFFFA